MREEMSCNSSWSALEARCASNISCARLRSMTSRPSSICRCGVPRRDRRGRTAAPHAGRAGRGLPHKDARRQRNSLFRQGKSLEDGCPRRQHSGAPAFRRRGRSDAGGLAPPVRAAASSGLRSQFPGHQCLARRNLCSRRCGLLAASRFSLLNQRGLPPTAFSGRPPSRSWFGSLGRIGDLAGRS